MYWLLAPSRDTARAKSEGTGGVKLYFIWKEAPTGILLKKKPKGEGCE